MTQPPSTGSIRVDVHPPERGRRRVVLFGPGCCSCSCCCLHTVGGLVGAAIGSVIAEATGSAKPWGPPPGALAPFRPSEGSLREHVAAGPGDAVTDDPSRAAVAPRTLSIPQTRSVGGLSGTALYWLTLVCLTLCAGPALWAWFGSGAFFLGILFAVVMILPAIQLAASLASGLLVLLYEPADRMARWRAIGIITGWSLLGAAAGVLLLFVLLR